MNRLRSILLSGLVALLMVGMVSAADVNNNSSPADETDSAIGIFIGGWVNEICTEHMPGSCLKLWISVDLEWVKNLLL